MSIRKEKFLALASIDYADKNIDELRKLFREVLKQGMHGLCFSPYEEGQEPGDQLSEAQIRRKLELILPYTKWIRTFSCTEGNEQIPKLAKEYGLKTLVGAWLGDDAEIKVFIVADHGEIDCTSIHGDGHRIDPVQARAIPVKLLSWTGNIRDYGADRREPVRDPHHAGNK